MKIQPMNDEWKPHDQQQIDHLLLLNFLENGMILIYTIVIVTPTSLGITRDHVSWPAMETMILTMMMISMSTDGSPTTPLRLPLTATDQPSSSHPDNSMYGRW